MTETLNTFRAGPDEDGHFGIFGGRYVAETLMPLLLDVEKAYEEAKVDPAFQRSLAIFWNTMWDGPARCTLPRALPRNVGALGSI